ncbi:hypothetical protein BDY21DRAFT_66214 [Lineolata rhizophorae]|uniref:TBP-associated factor 6 n=1 Tax=Lineolata rhizophorae TaxID=578093 RepID=A0A6A6NVE4_9PEZI|nr:hypothetical protein BDY21DRAFT_66214 [Lineolata rhizophorae]
MSVWNPENIRDVAESMGVSSLNNDIASALARDVEFRITQVLDEALKFMRHGKRTTLTTQDISQALRVLNVEPLYGYESTRPLRFGEASLGPGQPLFYVEDEEVDFEKLINAPLPKVPREISVTAHWLAVEGVQPSIPQNPTTADARQQELLPKGPGANTNLAALAGHDTVSVKPLVKHVLSKELTLYFDRIIGAILHDTSEENRLAALASLRTDPGIHQLVPYFTQFVAEKVTHNLKDLFVLTQMMHLISALLDNPSLYLEPYVQSIIPSALTCLIGKRLGSGTEANPLAHFDLRELVASLINAIARKYGAEYKNLRPRLARTLLKNLLDPNKSFGSHYGALIGLNGLAGAEGFRTLVLPNLKYYDVLLKEGLADETRKLEAEMVLGAILRGMHLLEKESKGMANREHSNGSAELKEAVQERIGEVVGAHVFELGHPKMIAAVMNASVY